MPDYRFTIQRRVTQQAEVTIFGEENKTAAQASFERAYRQYPDFPPFENFDTNGWPEIMRIEELRDEATVANTEVAPGD